MVDIRQTRKYASYMQRIGWTIEKIDGIYFYIKKWGIFGSTTKIQRPKKLPNIEKLNKLKKKHRASFISIEPEKEFNNLPATTYKLQALKDPYLPTKNILIDLSQTEEQLFKSFTQAKRRAVRKAQKNGVEIKKSNNSDAFIKLKNKSSGPLGFMTTTTVKQLWDIFQPKDCTVLLAYFKNIPVASVLLLFSKKTCYYWLAAATKEGRKYSAPTLLVWEVLKLAKRKKCTVFDFEGIYDDRFPKRNKNWLGFTKFKLGFGGKEIYYPEPLTI